MSEPRDIDNDATESTRTSGSRRILGQIVLALMALLVATVVAGFADADKGKTGKRAVKERQAPAERAVRGDDIVAGYLCHPIGAKIDRSQARQRPARAEKQQELQIGLGIVVYPTRRHINHGDAPTFGKPRQTCEPFGQPDNDHDDDENVR